MAMVGAVYADPITVQSVGVQEVDGDYVVLVSLKNADPSTGIFTELDFTVQELGTTVTKNVVVSSNETEVLSYSLDEVVSDLSQLKKGNNYVLEVSSDSNTVEAVFQYGSLPTDENSLGLLMDTVSLNGIEVSDVDTLQVLNGGSLQVQLKMTASQSMDDARIRVSIDGYEHSILDDSTDIFAVEAGKTYVKSLNINLPADMDSQEDYVLRIVGANDLSGITYKEVTLYVDTQRHRVDVLDLVMTPSSGVEPGQNIIANVRLKNRGQKAQDSVKVSVAIPELGISESSYVSNLDKDEVVTSDDMLLFVPEDAQAKQYQAVVTLAYNDGYTESVQTFSLNVLAPLTVPEKNLLVSFKNNIDLTADEESVFDVVIANPNDESKPISLTSLDNTWADVEVSPTLKMIKGGDSAAFTVKVTPKSEIAGEKELVLFVKEGTNTVSEVNVSTYVEGSSGLNWVNVVLAVLLILAIIVLLALIVTIAKRREEEDEDLSSNEEYY